MASNVISKLSWAIIILGTVVMVVVMTITGKPLKTIFTPHGIVDLELATNAKRVHEIFDAWQAENKDSIPNEKYRSGNSFNFQRLVAVAPSAGNISVAKKNTYLDFIFIIFYTSLFVACCKALSRKLIANKSFFSLGRFMAKAAIAAALLDVVENTGMLISLSGNITEINSLMTMTASSIKWLIVFCTIIYIVVAFICLKTRKPIVNSQ